MIRTPRLDLVVAVPDPPALSDPHGVLANAADLIELRRAQLAANPAIAPWLVRAIVLRDTQTVIGTAGFHDAPDADRRVEIGYEIAPPYQRRGYALEAATALVEWARAQHVRTIRASVSPANTASLALVARLGFTHVGEQIDEIDGRELVFERDVRAPATTS